MAYTIDLTGKVAVVTGASKGIGAAIAKHLAAAGASVVVNYASSQAGADAVVAEIVQAGGKAIAVGGSVAVESEVAALFAAAKDAYGKVDILVNNAGVFAFVPLENITAEEYHRQFDINVLGVLLATKNALPLFPEAGGSVINISSAVSRAGMPAHSVYSSSKGAVDTITKSLAQELGPRQIRVNAINPGLIITEGVEAAGFSSGEVAAQVIAGTPMGRLGQLEDVALPVVFLASDAARWITGETILISGGMAI